MKPEQLTTSPCSPGGGWSAHLSSVPGVPLAVASLADHSRTERVLCGCYYYYGFLKEGLLVLGFKSHESYQITSVCETLLGPYASKKGVKSKSGFLVSCHSFFLAFCGLCLLRLPDYC